MSSVQRAGGVLQRQPTNAHPSSRCFWFWDAGPFIPDELYNLSSVCYLSWQFVIPREPLIEDGNSPGAAFEEPVWGLRCIHVLVISDKSVDLQSPGDISVVY